MSIKVSVVCFKSKVLANGENPLMLRVTENKKRVMKSLGVSVNPKFWDFAKEEPKPKCGFIEKVGKGRATGYVKKS